MSDLLLKAFDETKESLPELNVGDDVTVHVRINVGERNERSQIVRGTVIRMRRVATTVTLLYAVLLPTASVWNVPFC